MTDQGAKAYAAIFEGNGDSLMTRMKVAETRLDDHDRTRREWRSIATKDAYRRTLALLPRSRGANPVSRHVKMTLEEERLWRAAYMREYSRAPRGRNKEVARRYWASAKGRATKHRL